MVDYTLETFPWASYHNMIVKDTPELPSKHHYFLVPPIVPGFALNDKSWSKFSSFITPTNLNCRRTAIFGIWTNNILGVRYTAFNDGLLYFFRGRH